MSDKNSAENDKFLDDLETAVRRIITNKKASKADQLSAINAGVKIAAIKHKIRGGDDDKGFFGQ
jgi:ribosomal protein S6E (S10)